MFIKLTERWSKKKKRICCIFIFCFVNLLFSQRNYSNVLIMRWKNDKIIWSQFIGCKKFLSNCFFMFNLSHSDQSLSVDCKYKWITFALFNNCITIEQLKGFTKYCCHSYSNQFVSSVLFFLHLWQHNFNS